MSPVREEENAGQDFIPPAGPLDQPGRSSTSKQATNNGNQVNPNNRASTANPNQHVMINYNLSERQLKSLVGDIQVHTERKSTFSSCSARFNGGRSTSKVEDFIATILVFKDAEGITDQRALISLPLLFEGYASSWWQGVQHEAKTFAEAIQLLRDAFAPPKPDWRLYAEIFQDKQKINESTDSFICRKRQLFAQLKERLAESTIINMLFSQLNIKIREKISRESVQTFQDLLSKAREIEMCMAENRFEPHDRKFAPQITKFELTNSQLDQNEKSFVRCSYCRKRNHTADVCYKRIEKEKKGKPEENKLHCYGCGAVGFYRSNCPTCNNKNVMESPKFLDFNSIETSIVGRNVPTVEINVNGLKGEAYLDTAARTSIAGYYLYKKLKEKEVNFQNVHAEITLADGMVKKEVVCSTIVDIIIANRLKRIRFICLPNAKDNRTLLGIDFLEQSGIVMDLAQRTWHFKDEPSKIFEFKRKPSKLQGVGLGHVNISDNNATSSSKVDDLLSWFISNNESPESHTPKVNHCKSNDYSPGGLFKIFEDSLPTNFEMPQEENLFPPLKKSRNQAVNLVETYFELNAIDFNICENGEGVITTDQKRKLTQFLANNEGLFENICSPIKNVTHKIDTGNHHPISNPPYRISPAMKDRLKTELDDMLSNGIIEETQSPWSFPVVLIPKKDNSVRLCVDYRKLNAITVTDTYPLPRMEDLLHAAKTTPFMSTLDLKSGYWQIKMSEEDKLKTAFTTPFGIFVFNRMPFGLKNAPATFQRIIDKFRSSLPNILILAYLDDIIICSSDFESHLTDLDVTFQKLKDIGFHLNREKCFFCKPEVKYLGHILTKEGIKIDPEKTSAIMKRPRPKNLKQLMSFLQTCSWFRRFIPNFAKIAKPLSNLTKKSSKWKWTNIENEAYEKLKNMLSSPPVLQQVNETQPFFLRTDASNYAIGAVLLQGEKESEHPIEYASRLLIPAERNYSTTEREALAVVWAIQKFRGYIEGSEVTVLTDHQPLRWLFSLKSPTGRLARWAMLLQSYNLCFNYTPGKQNVIADTLSRPPCSQDICTECCECNAVHIDFPRKGLEDFRKSQLEDECLKNIISSFENNDENVFRHTNRGYIMVDGILYRFCSEQDSENGQLVIPKSLRHEILQKYHSNPVSGHYGVDKTINRIAPLFYWPGMRLEITNFVKSCDECKRYKPSSMKPIGLLQTLSSNKRFEIIAVDLFGPLPRTSEGYQWILIVEDICSRWVELFALKEGTAENCALTLLNEVILRYGVPRRLHTDNGTQFISALMQKLTFCLGITQTFTPIYHPEANPVERRNRDLKTQLSIFVGTDHRKWNLILPAIRFAMNTAKCDSTGYTPAYLTFGKELRTPMEVHYDFKAIVAAENFIPQITPHLLKLADTLQIANDSQIKMQDRNKIQFDRKRKSQTNIEIGDKVLIATNILSKAKDGVTSKFTPRRDGPYVVIAKKGSSCFTVASIENPNTPLATLHVSALTPYEGQIITPIYPKRKRGRPASNNIVNYSNGNSDNSNEIIINNNDNDDTNNVNSNNSVNSGNNDNKNNDDGNISINPRRSRRLQEKSEA